MKLSIEQKELLQDWLLTDSARQVNALLEGICQELERDVVRCKSDEPQKLVILRAQGEGARRLLVAWNSALNSLKPKQAR